MASNLNFDLWVKGLLFLFPIFLVSVPHWASGFFILLCLSSFFAMAKYGRLFWQASKLEWVLMCLVGSFFISFVLTSLVNEWDRYATRALGTELRFLLFIPLYLMTRQVPGAFKFFAIGCLLGVFANFTLVAYEIYIQNAGRSNGVYGPLFVGPVTVLLAAVAIYMIKIKDLSLQWFFIILVLAVTVVVAVYSSRSALLGAIVLTLYVVITQLKKYRRLVIFLLLLSAILGVQFHATVNSRVISAYKDTVAYIEHEINWTGDSFNPRGNTSAGTRLEMGKAVLYLLSEKPVFGVGRYAYADFVKKYMEQGVLNPAVAMHSHPHSMLLAAVFFKGLLGLLVVVAVFVYLFWFFMRQQAESQMISHAGIAFLLAVLVTQATESAVLIKGNFIATFLVILTVLFAYKMEVIQQPVKRDA